MTTRVLAIIFLVVAFLGFLDSTYLTVKDFLGEIPLCSIIEGCEKVLTSPYSKIAGLPTALLGAVYYLFIFILAALFLDTKKEEFLRLASWLTIIGFLVSIYFTYLQLFVLGAICPYCVGSATTSTILFILGLIILNKKSKTSL